jgi:hypothetical protein
LLPSQAVRTELELIEVPMKKKLEVKDAPDWNTLMRRWNYASAAYEAAAVALDAALESGEDTNEYEADEKAASAELKQIKSELDALIQEKSAARSPSPDSLVIGFVEDDEVGKSGSVPVSEKSDIGRAPKGRASASPATGAIGRKAGWPKP